MSQATQSPGFRPAVSASTATASKPKRKAHPAIVPKLAASDDARPEQITRRCRVGGLAIIVGFSYPGHQRNLGKIVEVMADAGAGAWRVEVCGAFLYGTEPHQTYRAAHILDEWLRPLIETSARLCPIEENAAPEVERLAATAEGAVL